MKTIQAKKLQERWLLVSSLQAPLRNKEWEIALAEVSQIPNKNLCQDFYSMWSTKSLHVYGWSSLPFSFLWNIIYQFLHDSVKQFYKEKLGTPYEFYFFWIKSVHKHEPKKNIVCARTQIAQKEMEVNSQRASSWVNTFDIHGNCNTTAIELRRRFQARE